MTPFVNVLWPSAPPPTGIVFGDPVTTLYDSSVGSPFEVNIPPDLNGKLCLIALRHGRSPVHLSTPAGWESDLYGHSNSRPGLYWRACDGTEGATISIEATSDGTTPTDGRVAALAYPVTGVATNEAAYLETASIGSSDPPALTPSWGSAENRWLAFYSSRYSDWSVDTYPTNYVLLDALFNNPINGINGVGIVLAHRTLTAVTEDPSPFILSGEVVTERSFTIALRPAT